MKTRRLWLILCLIFILICAALYIYIYVVPSVEGALTETFIVQYDHLVVSRHEKVVFVREEELIKASESGNVSYYVDNNTKTRKGTKILDVYGKQASSYYCRQTGVVCYYTDGLEESVCAAAINDEIAALSDEEIVVKPLKQDSVTAGDTLYKLITGETWRIVFSCTNQDAALFTEGSSCKVRFDNGEVKMSVESIAQGDTSALVTLATVRYYDDYDRLRIAEADIILSDNSGLIIPDSAIAYEDGNPGVYVKTINGDYQFTRIKIISSDGGKNVVSAGSFSEIRDDGLTYTVSTIDTYDEILQDALSENQNN